MPGSTPIIRTGDAQSLNIRTGDARLPIIRAGDTRSPHIWAGDAQPLNGADWRVARLLDEIWRAWFADVPRVNTLVAGYDYPWKRHLGRIRLSEDGAFSEIGLNRALDDASVPDPVRVAILAHEIVHYSQGFGSPLPRRQPHPHARGAVDCELAARGLGDVERFLDAWLEHHWDALRERRGFALAPTSLVPCAPAAGMVY